MKDLIERQAAIELAMQYCPDDDGTCSKADEDIRNLLDELEGLPSAQPEIIHCGDCKHYVDVRNRLTVKGSQGKCESLGMYTHSEWYCGNAEREEDA